MNQTQLDFVYNNRNTISSASASFCSTIAGFPLDSVKSRLQVKRYSSVLDCVSTTFRDEGVGGFFRGVTIPLLTITFVRTASFTIYTKVKENLIRRNLAQDKTLGGVAFCGAIGGISSGMLLSVGTTAFEFAKVKQQLEYLISTQRGLPYKPSGTLRGFAELYRKGGIRMLYTGFYLHAARDTIGTGLYFSFYDSARFIIQENADSIAIPKYVSTFVCGSAAGIASWVMIYPIDLVKAKIQRNALAEAPREAPWHIFKRISSNGITKLYRGLGVSAARSLMSHGLMWTLLEAIRSNIVNMTGHEDRDSTL